MAIPRLLSLLLALPFAACSGILSTRGGISASALVAAAPPPVDSADALSTARAAQARFEIVRFARLPWTDRIPTAPRCDEIVGRFCLWFDDVPEMWKPPPEVEDVKKARDGLLAWLAAAEEAHPADRWIVGQRVRYLVEAGRHNEAELAAQACRAERWWCLALGAFVQHSRADFGSAESAFDQALLAMPDSVRTEWTDLTLLLDPAERESYAKLSAEARAELERRFWHLANPLHSRPGNARRSEHFARHVLVRLYEDARSPDRERWGNDSREIVLRYGAAAGWERARPTSLVIGAAPIVTTHFASGGRHFLPSLEQVREPSLLDSELLARDVRAPRTEYAPAYADRFDALTHQVALFRRGDSVLVAAAWEVPRDTLTGRSLADTSRVEAALVLGGLEGTIIDVQRRTLHGRRGQLLALAPASDVLASVEIVAPEERRVARGRIAVRPGWTRDQVIALSDLLLIAPADEPPGSLDEALPIARPEWTVSRGDRAGIYWELYAADTSGRRSTMMLSLTREGRSWPRRLAERLGLRDGSDGLRLQWEERTSGEIAPRAVMLDLGRIEPGTYTLELRVQGENAVARRRLVITR